MEGVGKIKFVGIDVPLYSTYNSIDPLDVEGHLSLIAKSVVEKFNWNYEGETIGSYLDRNGTEIVEWLARNESDVSFFPTNLNYKEFRQIDYSPVAWVNEYFIASSDGSATFKSTDFAFISIYSSWVWLAWLVCFIIFATFRSSTEKILTSHLASLENNDLSRNLLNMYRMLLNQGADLPPSGLWQTRLALYCWILGCFVLNAGFTGCLLSKLTLPSKPTYIETNEDILKHPNIHVLVTRGDEIELYLKGSTDKVGRQLWEQILRFDSAVAVEDLLDYDIFYKKIIKGEMVGIFGENVIREVWPLLDSDCGDLKKFHISEVSVYGAQWVFPMRKNLEPWKAKIIKRTIQHLFEADIIMRSMSIEYWRNKECYTKDPIPLKKLQLSSTRVVFFGLILGYLISVIGILFELNRTLSYHKRRGGKSAI